MAKAVIFDIDGTLSDVTHRLHHITGNHKNYDAFFAEVGNDPVIEPVCELARVLARQGYKLILRTVGHRARANRGMARQAWRAAR